MKVESEASQLTTPHPLLQICKLVCADNATLALTLPGDVYHWGKS
jgi:alpha-tubulin suppressor-like RCC1 family protein